MIKKLNFSCFSLCVLVFLSSGLVSSQEIERSIYLTGNTSDVTNNQVLTQIASDAKSAQDPMLLLLGNAAPEKKFKSSLDQQLQLIKGFKKDAIFIAGSQEWLGDGYRRVKDIEKYIQKNSKAKF